MQNRYGYNPPRFVQPESGGQIVNPYDQDSRLFQDLFSRGINPVYVHSNLDLTNAGELYLNQTGFHFCVFGNDGSAIETVNTTAFLKAYINQQNAQGQPFPAKHARGFSGPFAQLYFSWPAQSAVYARIVVYKGAQHPWIDGESAT